ncbi:hypothetical protein [Arthrobacter sp. 35W]|uniref:hypothetical protein n=1 Tax=Arthrobacter sp. 35W TaxID=1132441 RepID=UPI000402B226|nr:hypothetical protein [Arthrobacter sp. 35W]
MLNDFFETAPPLYKWLVFGAMGLTALGIILVIIGAATGVPAVNFTGLAVIGAGMLGHIGSLMVRGRVMRQRLKGK